MADTILDKGQGEAAEIARGLRRRDPELIDRLIERYQYRLFRYLLFLTGHRDLAEDLFQETWMRVMEKGHLYDGRTRFESWLFTVARNLFVDLMRRRKPALSIDELADHEEDSGGFELSAETEAQLEELAREEESMRIGAALSQLPTACREVLVLRFHEDMALDEIATVVSAPLSTVKSRLYRGLDMLRESLEDRRS